VVGGGAGIAANLYVGGNTSIQAKTASTSTSTGALVVAGGVGISGNLYVGGNLNPMTPTIFSNITASTSTSTGALVVAGGVAISGSVNIGGNNTVGNCAFLSTISEKTVNAFTWSATTTVDYRVGGIFWLGSVSSGTTFTVNISNLPSITDATRSYIITLIYTTTGATQYCNSVGISTGTSYTTYTPKFNGGSSVIVTANTNLVTQQITIAYIYSSTNPVLTTVSVFS
jgi:hypothetical protein